MLITLDCSSARAVLKVLRTASADGALQHQELSRVLATPGYRLFFDHHNRFDPGSFTEDHFRGMLEAVLGGDETYAAPSARVARMRTHFEGAFDRLDQLEQMLAPIEDGGWLDRAAARARRWLPPEADLSAGIFFLLDGCSGGYILGPRIGMDLLQYDGRLEQLEGVIAHELHHAGFASVSGPADEADLAGKLAAMFLGEGSATVLVFGEPGAGEPGYGEWVEHQRRMAEHFQMTRQYLERIEAGQVSAHDFEREVPDMYLRGFRGAGYAVGAAMVRVVLEGAGEKCLIDCMRRPASFIQAYRDAAAKLRGVGSVSARELHEL